MTIITQNLFKLNKFTIIIILIIFPLLVPITFAQDSKENFDTILKAFNGIPVKDLETITISCKGFLELFHNRTKTCNLNKLKLFVVENNTINTFDLEITELYADGTRTLLIPKINKEYAFISVDEEVIFFDESQFIFVYYGNSSLMIRTNESQEIINPLFLFRILNPGEEIIIPEKDLYFYRPIIFKEKPFINVSAKKIKDLLIDGILINVEIRNINMNKTYTVRGMCVCKNIDCNSFVDSFSLTPYQKKTKSYIIVPSLQEKNITYSKAKTLSDRLISYLFKGAIINFRNYENLKIVITVESDDMLETIPIEISFLDAYFRPIIIYNYLIIITIVAVVFLIIDSFIKYKKGLKQENE
ncbi:MAG: hypothetical protein QXD62_02050 [Candidatus Woesearchaeota archaeon]